MNVLVTGGAGYIGSTLVPLLLAQGHRVRVLDTLLHGGHGLLPTWSHKHFEFKKGDIRDTHSVAQAVRDMDAVVHLAAVVGDPACSREPDMAIETNVGGSHCLLKAAQEAGVARFIFASTCSNYGKMPNPDQFVDEASELKPVSLYAKSKVAGEQAVLAASRNGFCATCLRFATVFGVSPRMRFDLTVNEFAMEMLLTRRLVVFGEQFWRPYVHVGDIARAIARTLAVPAELVAGEVFNVGATEHNHQKRDLVEMVLARVPGGTAEYVHKEEDPRDYRVSFSKIEETMHFEPTRSVREGIDEVVALVSGNIIDDFANPRYRN